MKYDFAFSLGNACACSRALRFAGLQFASYPFDWTAGASLERRVELLENGFVGWLDADALELTDVLGVTFNTRIYRNRKTGITFSHDFPMDGDFQEILQTVTEKYRRRINRLYAELKRARRILAVYAELPFRPPEPDQVLLDVCARIQRICPQAEMNLLYFSQDDAALEPISRKVSECVTRVAMNYRTAQPSEPGDHAAKVGLLCDYFSAHVEVPDGRTEEEKKRHEERLAAQRVTKWGTGLEAFVNRRLYCLYRRLERILADRHVIPQVNRPLKLY